MCLPIFQYVFVFSVSIMFSIFCLPIRISCLGNQRLPLDNLPILDTCRFQIHRPDKTESWFLFFGFPLFLSFCLLLPIINYAYAKTVSTLTLLRRFLIDAHDGKNVGRNEPRRNTGQNSVLWYLMLLAIAAVFSVFMSAASAVKDRNVSLVFVT